jgi:hypothetical protein
MNSSARPSISCPAAQNALRRPGRDTRQRHLPRLPATDAGRPRSTALHGQSIGRARELVAPSEVVVVLWGQARDSSEG